LQEELSNKASPFRTGQ